MIPPVVASERGRAQTGRVATRRRGCRTTTRYVQREGNPLERGPGEGDRPVPEARDGPVVS